MVAIKAKRYSHHVMLAISLTWPVVWPSETSYVYNIKAESKLVQKTIAIAYSAFSIIFMYSVCQALAAF